MSLYHGIIFLCPGLYKKELKKITELYKCSILLFLLSNCFFYYYVLPITWKFFFDFLPKISNLKITIQFEPKLQEYLDFFFGIYYIININLLLIIILISYLYQKKNILITLKNKKKLFIFLFFFLAAIVTPPDLFNQISTAFSIIIVYEIITIKIILEKILLTWKQIKTY
jgi:sec-independent protein translocase protein TatC